MSQKVQLSKGMFSLVDEDDIGELSVVSWYAFRGHGPCYAVRHTSRLDDPDYKQHTIWMHRAIWEMHNGPIPKGLFIDHINGDSLDNRLENLRLCTIAQNGYNRRENKAGQSSRFKGVYFYRQYGKWRAQIQPAGRLFCIGYFDTEEEAAREYDKVAKRIWGERAHLNFKEE